MKYFLILNISQTYSENLVKKKFLICNAFILVEPKKSEYQPPKIVQML